MPKDALTYPFVRSRLKKFTHSFWIIGKELWVFVETIYHDSSEKDFMIVLFVFV
jgi:hypothetical protein